MVIGRFVEFLRGTGMPETEGNRRSVAVRIEGRVQGVYYRAWTRQTAVALGLDGTVRNMHDGSVEATFAGSADSVAEMLRRCANGPRDAKVSRVTVMQEGASVGPGFEVLRSYRR
jgi:acylphosphatase